MIKTISWLPYPIEIFLKPYELPLSHIIELFDRSNNDNHFDIQFSSAPNLTISLFILFRVLKMYILFIVYDPTWLLVFVLYLMGF